MTTISVSERLSVTIVIDHKELDLTYFRINFLQILTGTNIYLPYGQLQLVDLKGYFQNNPLGDNQTCVITLITQDVKGNSVSSAFKMRIFKPNVVRQASVSMYQLILIYDAPRYIHESTTASFGKVSSSSALQSISALCGMQFYNNAATSDVQTWLGNSDKYCINAVQIASAGYIDRKSCMVIGVTESGVLVYVDVSKLDYLKSNSKFSNAPDDNTYFPLVGSVKELTRSGFNNTMNGYKAATVAQTPLVSNSGEYDIHSNVSVTSPTTKLAYNANIAKAIKGGKVLFSPVNCGNVHDNYEAALHQNRRLRSMYGISFELTTSATTQLQLLNTAILTFYDIQGSERTVNKAVSGGYLVTAKGIFVTANGTYYEKFHLTRQGKNNIFSSSQAS